MSRTWTWTVPLVFLLALAGCGDRHVPAADAGQPRPAPDAQPAATPEAAVSLEDVVERDPRYLVPDAVRALIGASGCYTVSQPTR